ncbi:sperm-associated antigen 8 [Sceloporus undulatus]|uniref:sperm-associated antigen 8 n=1 Tax=Sceloporus undulatus TaxID=8520 RepID=UPI001C4CE179|nr:sperm-associated antigen 8 [Sceloporus undulatus]
MGEALSLGSPSQCLPCLPMGECGDACPPLAVSGGAPLTLPRRPLPSVLDQRLEGCFRKTASLRCHGDSQPQASPSRFSACVVSLATASASFRWGGWSWTAEGRLGRWGRWRRRSQARGGSPLDRGPRLSPPAKKKKSSRSRSRRRGGSPAASRWSCPPATGPTGPLWANWWPARPPRSPPAREPPRRAPGRCPPRGKCLLDNWQEERATNPLDQVPCPEMGTESYVFRGGHRGLLTLQAQAGLASATTTKEAFQTPRRTGLPVRGKREAMMEWLLYQKHSKEVFAEQVQAAPRPMESQSTTHRDFFQEGFVSMPPAPTKPHNYRLEQPQTFWRENAQRVTGVSCIRTEDTPFKKCAAFTTPAADYLEQPHDQETYPNF